MEAVGSSAGARAGAGLEWGHLVRAWWRGGGCQPRAFCLKFRGGKARGSRPAHTRTQAPIVVDSAQPGVAKLGGQDSAWAAGGLCSPTRSICLFVYRAPALKVPLPGAGGRWGHRCVGVSTEVSAEFRASGNRGERSWGRRQGREKVMPEGIRFHLVGEVWSPGVRGPCEQRRRGNGLPLLSAISLSENS